MFKEESVQAVRHVVRDDNITPASVHLPKPTTFITSTWRHIRTSGCGLVKILINVKKVNKPDFWDATEQEVKDMLPGMP